MKDRLQEIMEAVEKSPDGRMIVSKETMEYIFSRLAELEKGVLLKDYDDLREGDRLLVGNEEWEVVDDDGILGVWTNACKHWSSSLASELVNAGVRVLRSRGENA
jgi:hypothetical protein